MESNPGDSCVDRTIRSVRIAGRTEAWLPRVACRYSMGGMEAAHVGNRHQHLRHQQADMGVVRIVQSSIRQNATQQDH